MSKIRAQSKPVVPVGELVVGTVIPYSGRINASSLEQQGWLYCDGSAVARASYAQLFTVIGTLHGVGDGVNTFNLPDYRGYSLRGVDDGTGRDPGAKQRTAAAPGGATGDECGSVQTFATAKPGTAFTTTQDGSHTHSVDHIPTERSSGNVAGSYQAKWNSDSADTKTAGSHVHQIAGGDKETRPANLYVNYLIKHTSSQ